MTLNDITQILDQKRMLNETPKNHYYVIFSVGQGQYAIPLSFVERVLHMVAVTVLPEAPYWIDGVINYSGRIIPVVDLRQRFGEASKAPDLDDRLLIVGKLALRIDSGGDVAQVSNEQLVPIPEDIIQSRPIEAVIRHQGSLYLELDVPRLMEHPGDPDLDWDLQEFMASLETLYQQAVDTTPNSDEKDDFTLIKGIGEVYARRFQEAGLRTYQALADAGFEQIKAISKPSRRSVPDIKNWIAQARIMAERQNL